MTATAVTLAQIEKLVATLQDKNELATVARAVKERAAYLDSHRDVARLVCQDECWYADLPDGRRMELGRRLTTAETVARSRRKSPGPADFELTLTEAQQLRAIEPKLVGHWEETDAAGVRVTHYFQEPEYAAARREFYEWQTLAQDELALTLRLPTDGVRRARFLEQKGYALVVVA